MKLYEFNALDTEERAAVAMQGNFVDVRLEDGLKVALYSHPEFYSEVFYNGVTTRLYAAGPSPLLCLWLHISILTNLSPA